MATKLELELDRGMDDPADVLQERKTATQRYLDQLRKVVMNEPDKQPPKKDTY
tara:strand:- start:307 stop:465 length:159 start_codon:yes stop_codon:yes gene_type:complete